MVHYYATLKSYYCILQHPLPQTKIVSAVTKTSDTATKDRRYTGENMSINTLAEGIHWVGAVDWHVRDFHGYSTMEGTTYNAFLIIDEKINLSS